MLDLLGVSGGTFTVQVKLLRLARSMDPPASLEVLRDALAPVDLAVAEFTDAPWVASVCNDHGHRKRQGSTSMTSLGASKTR